MQPLYRSVFCLLCIISFTLATPAVHAQTPFSFSGDFQGQMSMGGHTKHKTYQDDSGHSVSILIIDLNQCEIKGTNTDRSSHILYAHIENYAVKSTDTGDTASYALKSDEEAGSTPQKPTLFNTFSFTGNDYDSFKGVVKSFDGNGYKAGYRIGGKYVEGTTHNFKGTLSITGGTGDFKGATGTLTISGSGESGTPEWHGGKATFHVSGTINLLEGQAGNFNLPASPLKPTPLMPDDCPNLNSDNSDYDVTQFPRLVQTGRIKCCFSKKYNGQQSFWLQGPNSGGHRYLAVNSLGTFAAPVSAQEAMSILQKNIESIFPDGGAKGLDGASIEVGRRFSLALLIKSIPIIGEQSNVICITKSNDQFVFQTIPHQHPFQGTVIFGIFQDSCGELWLFQQGSGPKDEPPYLAFTNYKAARLMWLDMTANLRRAISAQFADNILECPDYLRRLALSSASAARSDFSA